MTTSSIAHPAQVLPGVQAGRLAHRRMRPLRTGRTLPPQAQAWFAKTDNAEP
ncbi:hypothetical protein [Alicycliphilus denitrificans]|uniref:hypothetical protein n=1 Tax=Alicycliphilus denitrificans TaxID=179636 RepID=UPI00191501BA|nr:hypothetical protein [Alicycliphilus denitrificans]